MGATTSCPTPCIGQDKLQAWLARIWARKAVVMFDTCEAGALTERDGTRGLEPAYGTYDPDQAL